MQLARMPETSEIAAAAHLIVMRSRMDRVDDNIDALPDIAAAQRAEAAPSSDAPTCPLQVVLYVSRLEDRILGEDAADAPVGTPPGCIEDAGRARLLVAAGALAARTGDAEVREIISDPNFSGDHPGCRRRRPDSVARAGRCRGAYRIGARQGRRRRRSRPTRCASEPARRRGS